jgi:hypothetical protein
VNEEAMIRVGPQRHKKKKKKKKITVVIRNKYFRSFVSTHGLSYKKLVPCYHSWSCFEELRVITRCSMAVLMNREKFCSLLLEM